MLTMFCVVYSINVCLKLHSFVIEHNDLVYYNGFLRKYDDL